MPAAAKIWPIRHSFCSFDIFLMPNQAQSIHKEERASIDTQNAGIPQYDLAITLCIMSARLTTVHCLQCT